MEHYSSSILLPGSKQNRIGSKTFEIMGRCTYGHHSSHWCLYLYGSSNRIILRFERKSTYDKYVQFLSLAGSQNFPQERRIRITWRRTVGYTLQNRRTLNSRTRNRYILRAMIVFWMPSTSIAITATNIAAWNRRNSFIVTYIHFHSLQNLYLLLSRL